MKKINCLVFSLLKDQVQTMFKILNLGINFVSNLAQVGEARYIAWYTFVTMIQKQKTTKTINYNFFPFTGKLESYCEQ